MNNKIMNKQDVMTHLAQIHLMEPLRVVPPYAWAGHIPFAMYIVSLVNPKLLVELGTHSGNSFNAFCQAIKKSKSDTKCIAVDCWEGDEQAGFYEDDIYSSLSLYQKKHYAHFAQLKISYFHDAVGDFEDESIDLLHIDGLHTYEAVKDDFYTWLPKLSTKSIVLFHDTQVFDRNFGVYKLWGELIQKYPNFEFTHNHGLGVLIVGAAPKHEALNFVKFANMNEQWVRNQFISAAIVTLPLDARAYMMRLQLEADEEMSDKLVVAEMFLSDTLNFNESNKKFQHLKLQKNSKSGVFNLRFKINSNNKYVRFDPCHKAILLTNRIEAIAYTHNGKQELKLESTNCFFIDEKQMLFPEDPQLIFILPEDVIEIHVRLEYLDIGNHLNSTIADFARQMNLENKEHEKQIANYAKLRTDNVALIDKFQTKEVHINELQISIDAKADEYIKLRLETDDLIDKYHIKEENIKELQSNMDIKTDEYTQLRLETDDLIDKFQAKEVHINELQISIDAKTDEYIKLRLETDVLIDKYHTKDATINELQISMNIKTDEYTQLRLETDTLINKYHEKEAHIDEIQNNLTGKTKYIDQINADINALNERMNAVSEQLVLTQEERNAMSETISAIEKSWAMKMARIFGFKKTW